MPPHPNDVNFYLRRHYPKSNDSMVIDCFITRRYIFLLDIVISVLIFVALFVTYNDYAWNAIAILPRLYKNFHLADTVQLLYHATAGHMKQVEVQYNKTFRKNSVHSPRLRVRSSKAYLHLFTELYNSGHSYASSSRNAYSKIRDKIKNDTTAETFDNEISRQKRVAVLCGGIQGCLMCLVTIYDKSNGIMNRASVGGEGKVHLGLVYNKDLSMKTGKHMMRSALRFSSYIDYLVGKEINWDALKSERFNYLLTYSSLITPREFEDYASKLEEIYEDMLMEDPQLSYLGLLRRPHRDYDDLKLSLILGLRCCNV